MSAVAVDWVSLLGPGGAIAAVLAAWKIIKTLVDARALSVKSVVLAWQKICADRELKIAEQKQEIEHLDALADYWRMRAANNEHQLRAAGHTVPPYDPPPRREPVQPSRWLDYNSSYLVSDREAGPPVITSAPLLSGDTM